MKFQLILLSAICLFYNLGAMEQTQAARRAKKLSVSSSIQEIVKSRQAAKEAQPAPCKMENSQQAQIFKYKSDSAGAATACCVLSCVCFYLCVGAMRSIPYN